MTTLLIEFVRSHAEEDGKTVRLAERARNDGKWKWQENPYAINVGGGVVNENYKDRESGSQEERFGERVGSQ